MFDNMIEMTADVDSFDYLCKILLDLYQTVGPAESQEKAL